MDDISPATVERGYRSGAIGRCVEMHAVYYARIAGFGRPFEAQVAAGMADFTARLGKPCNGLWLAVRGERIVGTVAIDGEDLGEGVAHLRWLIVADDQRGQGLGLGLLREALAFCDGEDFTETHLWTFRGLDAARRLYEAHDFLLAEERLGPQWGESVLEQRFVRRMTEGT